MDTESHQNTNLLGLRKPSYQVQLCKHVINAIASSGPATAKGISHSSKTATAHIDRFLHSYDLNFSYYLAKLIKAQCSSIHSTTLRHLIT